MMPRLTSACIESSSGRRNACTPTSTHSGRPVASRHPSGLKAIPNPSDRMATTSRANGGGVASQLRKTPLSASASVAPIQISMNAAVRSDAFVADAGWPVLVHAIAVPQTSRMAIATGSSMNARMGGSASEEAGIR